MYQKTSSAVFMLRSHVTLHSVSVRYCSGKKPIGKLMILKILITVVLMAVCVPVVGAIMGLGIGMKGEKFVYPTVLVTWGVIIYLVWFG